MEYAKSFMFIYASGDGMAEASAVKRFIQVAKGLLRYVSAFIAAVRGLASAACQCQEATAGMRNS